MSSPNYVADLIRMYQDFNDATVDELEAEPSPLEFMRYVSRNRPFVVRGGARKWKAVDRWRVKYLKDMLSGKQVQVAATPNGRADAPTRSSDGTLYFAKPLEKLLPFEDVLERLISHESTQSSRGEIWYGQTQNDNLRDEYSDIFEDVERGISWARIALEKEPDAINMWIGSSKSTTALHRDPYQNIYVQTVGTKRFALIAPAEMACVNEHMLPTATWTIAKTAESKYNGGQVTWQLVPDEGSDPVPCALWDPDLPSEHCSELSSLCRPLRAELTAGDMLYLPALWYHKVTQEVGPEGFSCSVNYWYDLDFSGSFYASDHFLRQTTLQT